MQKSFTWHFSLLPGFLLTTLILHGLFFGSLGAPFEMIIRVVVAIFTFLGTALEGLWPFFSWVLVIAAAVSTGYIIHNIRVVADPQNTRSAKVCGVMTFLCVLIGLGAVFPGPFVAVGLLMSSALYVFPETSEDQDNSALPFFAFSALLSFFIFGIISVFDSQDDIRGAYADVHYELGMSAEELARMDARMNILLDERVFDGEDLKTLMASPLAAAVERTPTRVSFAGLDKVLTCSFNGNTINITKTQGASPSVAHKMVVRSLCARHLVISSPAAQ